MKIRTILLAFLGMSFVLGLANNSFAQNKRAISTKAKAGNVIPIPKTKYAASERRKAIIERDVNKIYATGRDCKRLATRLDIIEKLENELDCPLVPLQKVDERKQSQIEKQALINISNTYQLSVVNYFKKMVLEAEDKMGLIRQGDYITVEVKITSGKITKGGVFNGLFDEKRKIRIDDEIYLTKDFSPAFLERLDPEKSKSNISEYAQRKRNEYEVKKRRAYEMEIANIKEAQIVNNQAAGYIWEDNKWITAELFMDQLIAKLPDLKAIEEEKKRVERDARIAKETALALRKIEEKKEKMLKEKGLKTPKEESKEAELAVIINKNNVAIDSVRKFFDEQIQAWTLDRAKKNISADAVSGLDSMPWFATHKDIALFLSGADSLIVTDTMITYHVDTEMITGYPCDIEISFKDSRMILYKKFFSPKTYIDGDDIRAKIIQLAGKPTVGSENWMGFDYRVKIKYEPVFSTNGVLLKMEYIVERYDADAELKKLPPVK